MSFSSAFFYNDFSHFFSLANASCDKPPLETNAWAPLIMGTADLTQDCHTNAHYSTYDQSFADKQMKASYAHGEKAIYECYDDYMRLGGFGLE